MCDVIVSFEDFDDNDDLFPIGEELREELLRAADKLYSKAEELEKSARGPGLPAGFRSREGVLDRAEMLRDEARQLDRRAGRVPRPPRPIYTLWKQVADGPWREVSRWIDTKELWRIALDFEPDDRSKRYRFVVVEGEGPPESPDHLGRVRGAKVLGELERAGEEPKK